MFCGRKYAAYARINAAYRRALNGVRSTGKKAPTLCIWAALSDRTFGGNPPRRGRGVPKVVQNNQLCKIFSF